MPIKQLVKNGKPYAFRWGGHGTIYKISQYGIRGAQEKAVMQAKAAHAHGYVEKDSRGKNNDASQYGFDYPEIKYKPITAPDEYFRMMKVRR